MLVLIAEAPKAISSQQMAASVGTNASYVRKILGLLKKAKLIDSRGGRGGYALTISPGQLTLLDIHRAVMQQDDIHFLDIHQNPSDRCMVGRHIRPVLHGVFAEIEDAAARALADRSLADCIAAIRGRLDAAAPAQP